MSGLVTRPARLLTVLDAVAWWPIWVGALMLGRFVDGGFGPQVFRIFEETTGALFFFGVGAIVVLLWARTQRAELATRVHRTARGWLLQCGFGVLAIALGVRWDAYQLPRHGRRLRRSAGRGRLAARARAARAALAERSPRRPGRRGPDRRGRHALRPALRAARLRRRRRAHPPERARRRGGRRPLPLGPPRGHAPEVWRVDGELLARRLAARGRAMIGWAILGALWMTL
ncbi:MAG: hypothetical protein M5U28_02820 [Sandaracinaceae bacterium]|nr:hypothetical protein [Sandaracinaceae bacterium]